MYLRQALPLSPLDATERLAAPDFEENAMPHEVRSIVVDDEALVQVAGSLDSSDANRSVVRAIADAVEDGAASVVLDLARVDFAGVELVSALAACRSGAASFVIVVLQPPKTMTLAVDALRMRGRLDLRDEPGR